MTFEAVLLGAGASVEADVPASMDMTERIAQALDDGRGRYSGTTQALHYAIGAMIAHDTAQGGRAYDGVDVERLFAAIQMLAERDVLEVAPFVANWDAALESLGRKEPEFPAFFARNFQRAIMSDSPFEIERVLKQAIEGVVGPQTRPEVFRQLQGRMMNALRDLVRVNTEEIDYLAPLLALPRPINVATLNYDRSVEALCDRFDVTCDTGIAAWDGGHTWNWDDNADVRLLKLHGSIDWIAETVRGEGRLAEPRVRPIQDPKKDAREAPAVVFGQRGKLRSHGPYLPMLRAFDEMLSNADRLLVVGYSFRDDHINASIRKWLNMSPEHAIVIVDPAFSESPERGTFAEEMRRVLQPWSPPDKEPPPQRLEVISARASQGLRQLLGEGPTFND